MKKFIRFLLTLILIISITRLIPIQIFAYEYGSINFDSMVQIKTRGFTKTSSINSDNIDRIKNNKSIENIEKSDEDKLKEIFQSLEVALTDSEIENIFKKVSLSQISSITTQTRYQALDANDNIITISESKALELSYKNKVQQKAITPHDPVDTIVKDIMQMQIVTIYTPDVYVGRYVFIGSCKWLTNPSITKTDAIALYADPVHFTWKSTGHDAPIAAMFYNEYTYDSNGIFTSIKDAGESKDETDANISTQQGVFFDFNLPTDNPFKSVIYRDYEFMICAIARVTDYDDYSTELAINLQYLHTRNPLGIAITFEWGPIGVTTDLLNIADDDFLLYHSWDYATDIY